MVVDIVTTGLNVSNLCYKNRSVNVVLGNKGCLFRYTHKRSNVFCIFFVFRPARTHKNHWTIVG